MTLDHVPSDPSSIVPQPDAGETAFLLKYLETHDVPCPLCQYNLRHLTVPRCPECGREIRLTVGMVEPYLLPWILTTIFMAMAASIGVLFVMACVFYGPPPMELITFRTARDMVPCLSLSWGLLAVPLTLTLVAARRRFFRWDRTVQWACAVGVFFVNALLVLVVFFGSRY